VQVVEECGEKEKGKEKERGEGRRGGGREGSREMGVWRSSLGIEGVWRKERDFIEEVVGSQAKTRLGIVVGEASATEFLFVAEREVPRWEYVSVFSVEETDEGRKPVEVIAQVHTILSESLALPHSLSFEAAERIVQAGLAENRTIAKARVLGYIHNGVVRQPRMAIQPGKEVYEASEEVLRRFYSFSDEEGLFIGNLITRRDVKVSISVNGFRRHLAIIAQTGAGKSYTAGVLMEELLKKGATIVVLDPHADYIFLSQDRNGGKFSDRVSVFRTKESTSRYEEIGFVKNYEVRFSDLDIDEISMLCGISERWVNIKKAIRSALEDLREEVADFSHEELIELLQDRASKGDKDASDALKYVEMLREFSGIFGNSTTRASEFLKVKHVAVFDLSGLNDRVANYIAARVLREILELKFSQRSGVGGVGGGSVVKYPVFVFVEEAHRFIPKDEETLAKGILKRIAAEGRKFGIFLTLITQRPCKIDADALSQCNSQIIMRITNPEDQDAVRRSSERMSESLLNDLPGLNVGEAVIVGEITRAPVMVRIRQRQTREGGADIDTVKLLQEASSEAEAEDAAKEDGERARKEIERLRSIVEGL